MPPWERYLFTTWARSKRTRGANSERSLTTASRIAQSSMRKQRRMTSIEKMRPTKLKRLWRVLSGTPPEDLSQRFVAKCLICMLGLITSSLVLLISYTNLAFMARFQMPEKVLGRMAHDFATKAMRDSILAALSASVLTVCLPWIVREFRTRRK